MRHRNRLLLSLLPLALLALLLLPSKALAQTGNYVFDEDDVLSSAEFYELESLGAELADEYDVGVYLVYTDNMGPDESSGSGRNEFARSYYLNHNLGEGSGKDGIVFVVADGSRKYVTVKHFANKSNDPFSDDAVDALESDAKSYLKDNEWYEAGKSYYENVESYLRYFNENGTQWEEPHVFETFIKLVATLAIPALIAYGVVSGEKKAMLTARRQTEADDYLDSDSFDLRVSTDTFVNRSMSVVPIPKESDNDSGGGWSDMGGGFSGSGGGDF